MDNSFKMILWEDNKEYCQLAIELAHKEVVDRNKRLLKREALCKALDDDRIKELLKTGMFQIQWGTNDKPYIDPANSIGKILSIYTETNSAIIRVSKEIKEEIDKDEYVLIFNYMGKLESKGKYNEIIDPKIISAGLLKRSESAYEVEVV